MKRMVTLVVRPPADDDRLNDLRSAVRAIRAAGHRTVVRVTFEPGDARRFARAAALEDSDVVVAVGGDGTINEVVNGLASASQEARLGIVPFGTANDFAAGLGLPVSPLAALRVAVEGRPVPVDVARVNRRCFINVSTGGFGAAATQDASPGLKRRLGRLAYLLTGAQQFITMEPRHAVFRADGEAVHGGEFAFYAVGNGALTGGGMQLTPRADPADGCLDLVIARSGSRLDLVSLLPRLRAGTHVQTADVTYHRARAIEVVPEEELAVNADGEAIAGHSFLYDLLSRPLPLMLPA